MSDHDKAPLTPPPHHHVPVLLHQPEPPRRLGGVSSDVGVEPDLPGGRRPVPFSMAAGEGGSRRLTDEGSRQPVRLGPCANHRSLYLGVTTSGSTALIVGERWTA